MCPRFFWPHTNSIETIETIEAIEAKGIEGWRERKATVFEDEYSRLY